MNELSFKTLLEIILRVTQKRANILADRYLLKDGSIISKWKTNKVVPKSYDIERIVEFAAEETSPSQKRILRNKVEELVSTSTVQPEIKKLLLDKGDFKEFLHDTLSISVCNTDMSNEKKDDMPKTISATNKAEDTINGTIYKKDNRFKGTLEFDIGLPEKGIANPSILEDATNIELKGTVNMAPKNRFFSATKYFGKTSVLSILGIWLLAGLLVLSLTKPSADNHAVYSSKTVENYAQKQLITAQTSVIPSATPAMPAPTQEPSPTQVCKPTDVPSTQAPETKQASTNDSSKSVSENAVKSSNPSITRVYKKNSTSKNSNNTNSNNTNTTNANSNNITFSGNININGNGNNLAQGVDVTISKEGN